MSDTASNVVGQNLTFNSDVMGSIQTSISLKKPLMMYIKAPEDSTDNGINSELSGSDSWIDKIIFNNASISHFTRQLLSTEFVRLQIVKNSTDFNNLISIMPSFQNAPTPCIVFIYSGQIIDMIPNTIDVSTIDDKLKSIHQNLQNINGRINAEQSIPATPPPRVQIQQQTPRQTPPPVQAQSPVQPAISVNRATPTPPPAAVVPNQQSPPKKSLKEESAEVAASKYRESLLKQQKQAKLDRERILNLLNLDRQEQKNKEKEREFEKRKLSIDETQVHENLHNSKIQNSSTYTIQLKLLDGSTTRHNFKSTDKLLKVRDYVLEAYPDYNSFPFYFFKTIDRITFGEADENKTLMSLNLNRSTLILKPVEPEQNQNVSVAADNQSSSTFGWLRNKMYSYLWSSEPIQGHQSDHDRSTSTPIPQTSTDHHPFTSSISTHTQADDESDTDTIYHTPLLGSTTSSTSSLRPTMSSFNLYGSQGLIQPVSIASSTHDLTNGNQQQTPQHDELLDNGQQLSEDTTPTNQNNDRSLRNVRTVEDMDVNNGNSISLQFPDDE